MQQNQRTNVIHKKDVERYETIIPFSVCFGKRKKQFLFSELEKMHPCFSDEFTFDSAIRRFCRKGFKTDVLVMNKYKLAEYEGKRHFSGTGFILENNSNKRFGIFLNRFFVNSRIKLILWICLCCVLSGLVIVAVNKHRVLQDNQIIKQEEDVEITESLSKSLESYGQSSLPISLEPPLEQSLFETVAESHGKISTLEWSINGYSKLITVALSGVYPEKLNDFEIGTVIYENGIPYIKLSCKRNIAGEKGRQNPPGKLSASQPPTDNSEFIKSIRKVLLESGVTLKEETMFPYHFEFICAADHKLEQLLKKLSELINEDNKTVTSVYISKTDANKNEISTGLTIEPAPVTGFDLQLLASNLNLFSETGTRDVQKSQIQNSQKHSSQLIANKNEKNTSNQKTKIGEIKMSDSSTIVFYKNQEGKIEKIINQKEVNQ